MARTSVMKELKSMSPTPIHHPLFSKTELFLISWNAHLLFLLRLRKELTLLSAVTVNKYSSKKRNSRITFLLVKKYFSSNYYPGKKYSRWGKNAPLSWNFGCMFLTILYWECFFSRKDILPKKPFYCTLEFWMFW